MRAEAIPFLDLVTPHRALENKLLHAVQAALRTACFIGGPMVEEFEHAFAEFCSVPYCAGVGSGTDALRFALIAAGVGCGDSVITVPHTFIATTEAVTQAGAVPEFVDINDRTYTLDPEKLHAYLDGECIRVASGRLVSRRTGNRVAAIVPVHLYGQMADMDPILALAERYGLTVIEDACQAHGASYFSQKANCWCTAGSMGQAAAFSFYPGKNLGACGEAGAVTTSDEMLARSVRRLRDHGQAKKYQHEIEGYNGRLDAIQAAILRIKLAHLPEWNLARRQCAERYQELLAIQDGRLVLPYQPPWAKSVYHLYVVRVEDRDGLIAHLNAAGVGTGIHYPAPLHLQKAYASLEYSPGDFPVSEAVATKIVSLPMFPGLEPLQQRRVAVHILEFIASAAPAYLA